ncbi:MAG: alpha/beta fold hydrolase [Rhodospirillaceae bacterium]|nr:alpha/beta fold hydrolase [Rhodospirillaceae bacterium]
MRLRRPPHVTTQTTTRMGPRPLPLHLATQTLALMSSLAALPLLKNGSLSWNPNLASAAAELTKAIDGIDTESFARAVQDEALRRLDAFTAGVKLYQASTREPRPPEPTVIWQSGSARLLDYGDGAEADDAAQPILVIPSLVNRGYVLDLSTDRSLLRDLAGRGFRPLLMDWGVPGTGERAYSLTDYITGPLQNAFDFVTADGAKPAVVGYCMGGNLALALSARNRGRVGALALLATPWDFQAGQEAYLPVLAAMAPALEAIIETLGVLPTDLLQAMFAGLNPDGVGLKFRHFATLPAGSPKAREFIALEDWLNDGVPLAGPVARECLFDWYLDNTPATGHWRVAGEAVDPGTLNLPTLVIVPNDDYIVPPEGAKPLARLVPGAHLKTVKAGHIGMVAGRRARSVLYTPLGTWLGEHLN